MTSRFFFFLSFLSGVVITASVQIEQLYRKIYICVSFHAIRYPICIFISVATLFFHISNLSRFVIRPGFVNIDKDPYFRLVYSIFQTNRDKIVTDTIEVIVFISINRRQISRRISFNRISHCRSSTLIATNMRDITISTTNGLDNLEAKVSSVSHRQRTIHLCIFHTLFRLQLMMMKM